MMELKQPKRKRRVPSVLQQPFPISIGGISAISAGHWQVYYGRYLGDCVIVEDPDDMIALNTKGFFGKGSLSRDMPKFQRGTAKAPVIIRQRQWKRRSKWAEKQQAMLSNFQQMFTGMNGQNISEQTSSISSKEPFKSSDAPKKCAASEQISSSDHAVVSNQVDGCNERDEHAITKNVPIDKSVNTKTDLVMLDSEEETKEVVKPSTENKYDVIFLDSEEEGESVSAVASTSVPLIETRSSRVKRTSLVDEHSEAPLDTKEETFSKKCAQVAKNLQSDLPSGKEADVVSLDSEDSSILINDAEGKIYEKDEIIAVEENVRLPKVKNRNRGRNGSKRSSNMINDERVPKGKRRRTIGEDKAEISNEPGTSKEKFHALEEDTEVIEIVEECIKNSGTSSTKSEEALRETGTENGKTVNNGNNENAHKERRQAVVDQSDGIEKSENDPSTKKAASETCQDNFPEPHVPVLKKNSEEISAAYTHSKLGCTDGVEHLSTVEIGTESTDIEKKKLSGDENQLAGSKTSKLDTDSAAENDCAENSRKDITELKIDTNESEDKEDEDLVLVLSDSASDSEEYLKNLNPKLDKEMFPVRETLHLMLEEAFFLSFGLGCLQVIDMCDNILSLTEMWQLFSKADANFTPKYVAYHYFRSKGWIVKPGIKFGGDFLLYKHGPSFYHSSYIVIVEVLEGTAWNPHEAYSKSLTWTRIHGLVRLAESSGKEIMLCQVIWPTDTTPESMNSPAVISNFKVHEQLIRRWISSEEREEEDNSSE